MTSIEFFGQHFNVSEWLAIKNIVDCWAKNGTWVFNNKTIVDRIEDYRACHRFINYGPKNPCFMILDFNSLKYDWLTTCPYAFRQFRADEFCATFDGVPGDLIIVGDSVNKQLHTSLKESFLLSSGNTCDDWTDIDRYRCPNNSTLRVLFFRNDLISLLEANESFTKHAYETVWIHNLANVSLLILNRGAHFETDDKLMSDVNQTIYYVRTVHPNVSIIWRNTPPGVDVRAFVFTAPFTSPPPVQHRFHWEEFSRQNELVRQLLDTHYPEVIYLDVFSPSVLRSDAHYDELHYCIPGPLSVWVDLIFNTLVMISSYHLNGA